MPYRLLHLDRYILGQILGTMCGVLAVVMSLMILEHLPRLLDITLLSGRRGYIIAQTVSGLLPEYGGIGLLVGLFLSIALTIRKLALRGELDVIEACGIGPLRWMRFPLILAATVSVLALVNQGWLVPAGEVRLAELGQRMAEGEFGHRLQANQFIDLGSGTVLHFQEVDPTNGEIIGLFLRAEGSTIAATRGRLWGLSSGATVIELYDGQLIREKTEGVLQFSKFRYRTDKTEKISDKQKQAELSKRATIGSLWANGNSPSRSAVYGRCLWAALTLCMPFVGMVLGKPPRRQSGAVGIFVGVISLVVGLKMIAPLTESNSSQPELLAVGILLSWGLFVSGLIRAEKVLGRGFVDLWASRILQRSR
jgi:lipopolysaccharide export system permease protein